MQNFIVKNVNEVLLLEDQFNKLELKNEKIHINVFDISKDSYNTEINFHLTVKDCEFHFNYFCLNQDKYKKIIKINIYHEIEKTYSYIKYHGIGLDDSLTNLVFLSVNNIKPLANIYSEQEIREIIMNNAKFSGVPQINAANNSFTSAHKLMVGNVNKEELFYLMSLGINEVDSINILIETLYKSFLSDEEDNLTESTIKQEIFNAKTKKL